MLPNTVNLISMLFILIYNTALMLFGHILLLIPRTKNYKDEEASLFACPPDRQRWIGESTKSARGLPKRGGHAFAWPRTMGHA